MERIERADTLGQRIRKARIDNGITVPDMAERLDVTIPDVVRMENGQERPDEDTLRFLADMLGTSFAGVE